MHVPCSILTLLCAVPVAAAQSLTPSLAGNLEAAKKAQARQDCHTAAKEYGMAAYLMPRSAEPRSNEGVTLYCDNQLSDPTSAEPSHRCAVTSDGFYAGELL